MTAASDAQTSLQDDNSYQTVIVIVLTMVLANSAVLLRLLARRTMKLSLMADDYMAVLAAVRETRIPFFSYLLSSFLSRWLLRGLPVDRYKGHGGKDWD